MLGILICTSFAHFPIRCVPFSESTSSEFCGTLLPERMCMRDSTGLENLRLGFYFTGFSLLRILLMNVF